MTGVRNPLDIRPKVLKNWHFGAVSAGATGARDFGGIGMASERSLSRRERELMDALFQAGEATAADVRARMPAPPSYTAVRTMLRILEEKGLVEHRADGRRYVYRPRGSPRAAGRSALDRVLRVF